MRILLFAGLALATVMQSASLDADEPPAVERRVTLDEDGDISIKDTTPSGEETKRWKTDEERAQMTGSPPPPIQGEHWFNVDAPLSWDDLKGKVVLLDFWGIYCGPCVATIPKIQWLHEKFHEAGLVVIGVHTNGYGTAEVVGNFIAKRKMTYPIVMATDETFEAFGQWGLPTYFLIDRQGNIDWGFSNKLPWRRQIRQLLKENTL